MDLFNFAPNISLASMDTPLLLKVTKYERDVRSML